MPIPITAERARRPSARLLAAAGLAALLAGTFAHTPAALAQQRSDSRIEGSRIQESRDQESPNKGPAAEGPQRRGARDTAGIIDRQPALVRTAVEALAPRAAGRTNIYFVGAALYATQDVFIRELRSARSIVDDRLGTRGRSLLLINHRSTIADTPLASAGNLEDAVGQVAHVMDKDEDILFLFLTSHGTKGVLQVELPRYGLRNLSSEHLAQILKRSGIRHKIVVISACYSGSFIPRLADDTTLVITASSANRSSFGCSNERHWTYFGDAFFDRALRRTTDLALAFEMARATIARWEKEQKLTPSLPQISLGEGMREKLSQLGPVAALREPAPGGVPLPRRAPREAVR